MTNERPTPETDELSQSIITHNNTYACYEQMKMHARCLERERDEARELIDDIWITATSDHRFIMPPSKKQIPQHIEGIIKAYDKAHDDWTPEEIKTLMRERDEAWEQRDHLLKQLSAERALADRLAEAMQGVMLEERDLPVASCRGFIDFDQAILALEKWKEARSE